MILMTALTGCWDYRDVNKMSFPRQALMMCMSAKTRAEPMGHPKTPDQVDLTVIIPNLSQEAPSKFRIEKSSGISWVMPGQETLCFPGIYSAGVAGIIVFGKEQASLGLSGVTDALFRGALIPNIVHFSVSQSRGEDVLRTPVENYPSMADYLRSLLDASEKRGFIPSTTLHNFEQNQSPGKNPIMPLLKTDGKRIVVTGTAIFNKDRQIGEADLTETRTLMMLRGIKANGVIPFRLEKEGKVIDQGSIQISNRRKVRVERKGEGFVFNIRIDLAGSLVDHESGLMFSRNKDLQKAIEQQVAADVTASAGQFIKKMQREYKVDCIDISKYALAKWRRELEPTIDQDFIENVQINVDVKMHLENIGEVE
jgi:Ger(x)C family germination protein